MKPKFKIDQRQRFYVGDKWLGCGHWMIKRDVVTTLDSLRSKV